MSNIILETALVKYEILPNGQVGGIYEKRTGKNYLAGSQPQFFAALYRERAFIERDIHGNPGKNYVYIAGPLEPTGAVPELPQQASFENGILSIVFSSFTACFQVQCSEDYLIFELQNELPKDYYSMTIGKTLLQEFDPAEGGLCIVEHAMKINVKPHYYPSPLEHALGVEVFSQIGTTGAKLAFVSATQKTLPEKLRQLSDLIDKNEMIVSPRGGAFASTHSDTNLSYTIIRDIDNMDDALETYQKYCINQIDFHQGGAFRQGDMRFSDKYGNDPVRFRQLTAEPLKAAGKTVSLHTYSQLVSPSDSATLADPKAQQDLSVIETFTLSQSADPDAQRLYLNEDVSGVFTTNLYRNRHSPYLLVDQEIMKFEVSDGSFLVQRGMFGTVAAAHEQGAPVRHLEQMYNHPTARPGSELFFQIARNTANACNLGGFSMIYFDAFDSLALLSPEFAWYHTASFVLEVLKHCDNAPSMEYSIMFPLLWHARSRMGAWDVGHRGYQYFVDQHQKFNQNSPHTYALPQMLGWFNFYPSTGTEDYPGKENRILHFDDADFIGARALAYDNSMAYQYRGSILEYPKLGSNMDRFSQYEHLRVQKYFDDSILAQMRNDGQYALEKANNGYQIRRKHYAKAKVCPTYHQPSVATCNPFAPQKPFLRIEGLYSIGHQQAPMAQNLDRNHSYICFDQPTDFSATPCVKVKVTGNGSSDQVLVSLRSQRYFANTIANYVIPCDFEGQKEFIFAENCNGEFKDSDFEGKFPRFYSEYMKLTDYEMLQEVNLYFHGSCEGVSVDEITMMDCRNIPLVNPKVQIGSQALVFNCTLNAAEYIEYQDGKAMLYDIYGHGKEVDVCGTLPELAGQFTADITADSKEPYRAEVTFGFSGDILK